MACTLCTNLDFLIRYVGSRLVSTPGGSLSQCKILRLGFQRQPTLGKPMFVLLFARHLGLNRSLDEWFSGTVWLISSSTESTPRV